jgi:hypothetical protein
MPKHDEAAGRQLGVERNQVTVADQGGGDQPGDNARTSAGHDGRADGFVRRQLHGDTDVIGRDS